MNESGSGQLALNAKKIILPDDAVSISANKQVPTKEYVDNRVSASGTSGGASGGSFTLVGGDNYSPSCPEGYASALDGYWNCANGQGGNCFCGTQTSYSYYQNSFNQGYNQSYRCSVCYPTTSESGVSSDATVIWATRNAYNGNLGGRTGADAKCVADQPDYLKDKCSNVHAFLGTTPNDDYRDLPNCDIDMDGSVKSYYDCQSSVYWFARQFNLFTSMASNWKDLTDGTISQSTNQAGVYNATNYWSPSEINSNCSDWTSQSSWSSSYYGNGSYVDSLWLKYSNSLCSSSNSVLCACKMD